MSQEIGVIVDFALAKELLSDKYRSQADLSKSVRGGGVGAYLTPRGMRILAALDQVAKRHGAKPAEVALAGPMQAKGVTLPISSATPPGPIA